MDIMVILCSSSDNYSHHTYRLSTHVY